MEEEIKKRIRLLRRELDSATELEEQLELGWNGIGATQVKQKNSKKRRARRRKEAVYGQQNEQEDAGKPGLVRAMLFDTTGRINFRGAEPSTDFVKENRKIWEGEQKHAEEEGPEVSQDPEVFYRELRSNIEQEKKQEKKLRAKKQAQPVKEKAKKEKPWSQKQVVLPKLQKKILDRVQEEDKKWDRYYSDQLKQMQRQLSKYDKYAVATNEFPKDDSTKLLKSNMASIHKTVPNLFAKPVIAYFRKSQLFAALQHWKSKFQSVMELEKRFEQHLGLIRGLQARVRGKSERIRVNALLKVRAEELRRVQWTSAVTLQQTWRRYVARKKMHELVMVKMGRLKLECAQKCQSLWRGHRARRRTWGRLREMIWSIARDWFGTVSLKRALTFLEDCERQNKHGGKLSSLDPKQRQVLAITLQCMINSKERIPSLSPEVLNRLMQCFKFMEAIRTDYLQQREFLSDTLEEARTREAKERERGRRQQERERWILLKKREQEEREQLEVEKLLREEKELILQQRRKERYKEEEKKQEKERQHRELLEQKRKRRAKILDEKERQKKALHELQLKQKQELRDKRSRLRLEVMVIEAELLPQKHLAISFEYSQKRAKLRQQKVDLKQERERIENELNELIRTEALKRKAQELAREELEKKFQVEMREFERQKRDSPESLSAQKAIERCQRRYKTEIKDFENKHKMILGNVQLSRDRLSRSLDKNEQTIADLQKEFDLCPRMEENEKVKVEHDLRSEMARLEKEGEKEISQLSATHEQQRRALQKEHQQELASLQ